MQFARTKPSPTVGCESGKWEQRNDLTDWLDAGNVYGSNKEESERVRDIQDRALLVVSLGNLLPTCSVLRGRYLLKEKALFIDIIYSRELDMGVMVVYVVYKFLKFLNATTPYEKDVIYVSPPHVGLGT